MIEQDVLMSREISLSSLLGFKGLMDVLPRQLRRIPLNVRARSEKNIYQKTTQSTVTF